MLSHQPVKDDTIVYVLGGMFALLGIGYSYMMYVRYCSRLPENVELQSINIDVQPDNDIQELNFDKPIIDIQPDDKKL